jgi:hypothetical protein
MSTAYVPPAVHNVFGGTGVVTQAIEYEVGAVISGPAGLAVPSRSSVSPADLRTRDVADAAKRLDELNSNTAVLR